MNEYTTTMFGKVYLCYKLGDTNHRSFPSQMAMIAHECKHAEQRDKGYAWWYRLKYLLSKKWRAKYEIEAYIITIKTYYMFTKQLLNTKLIAEGLKGYGLQKYVNEAKIEFDKVVKNINIETNDSVEIIIRQWIKHGM